MPRIPQYEQQGSLPNVPMAANRSMASPGSQALIQAGQTLMAVADKAVDWADQQAREKGSLEFATKKAKLDISYTQAFDQLAQEDERDLKKYQKMDLTKQNDDSLVSKTNKLVDDLLKNEEYKSENRYTASAWAKYTQEFKASALAVAVREQGKFQVQAVELGLSDGIQDSARAVAMNPTLLDNTMLMWRQLLSGDKLDKDNKEIYIPGKGLTPIGEVPPELKNYLPVARPAFIARAKDSLSNIAAAAFDRMIVDDPKSAYFALKGLSDPKNPQGKFKMDLYGFSPDQYTQLLSKAKTQASAVNDYEVYKLETKIDDHIASVAATGTGLFTSKAQLAAEVQRVADPLGEGGTKASQRSRVMVERAWKEHEVVKRTFDITSGLRWLPDQEIIKGVNSVVISGENAASEAKIKNAVVNQANSFLTQRKNDVAAYFAEHPAAKQLYAEGKTGEARVMNLALQERAGVPEMDRKVLTDIEVANERKWLTSGTPNQVAERLSSFNQRYGGSDGKYQGQRMMAWRQLTTGPGALPPTYMFAASVMGTSSETAVIQALSMNEKTLQEGLGSLSTTGTSFADIKSKSTLIGQQYQKAFTGMLPGRQEVFVEGIQTLATKLAATEVLASGGSLSSDKALHNAYKKLTSAYDISGSSYFIPKPRVGAANTYVPDAIHRNASILLQSSGALQRTFAGEQLNYPKSKDPGVNLQPQYLLDQYLGTIRNSGYWVNNDTGTGLMLVVQTNAAIEPVTFVSGKRVELTFDQLSKLDIPKNVTRYQRGYLGMPIYPTK